MALQTAQMVTIQPIRINPRYLCAKRIFDIVFVLLFSPLIILSGVVIALWIDENVHRKKVEGMMRNGQTLDKEKNDPRVTRVGRFIRKTSLDEIPQFWNVLMGEMTLVGPRPPLAYEVALYKGKDWLRLSGCPGLTGPWQIYGRSKVTFADMVNMDLAYLEEQSLLNDIKLILLTIPVMISGRGAA
jgi:lipopolysaccharide/colanic/teichoic acid biosynthesis glycosyltransferase